MHTPQHPYSPHFAEHYWSGGAAEKHHVFLQGNTLPQRFAALKPGETFHVAELGFGTGLTFLLTAHLFETTAPPNAALHYTSYEKFPLTLAQLQPIHAALPPHLHQLAQHLRNSLTGHTQTLTFGRATLCLTVADAATAVSSQETPADAWFLDGFSPARNPDMWQPQLLQHIYNLTAPGGTAATYSAASAVREGLRAAGFHVTRSAGFPPKKHMLVAEKPA